MPVVKKIAGTGMTARVITELVVPGNLEEFIQDEENISGYFSRIIGDYLQNGAWSREIGIAKAVLNESGLPTQAGMFAEEDGQWLMWDLSDDCALAYLKFLQCPERDFAVATGYTRKPEFDRFRALDDLAEVRFGYESDQFFAARLLTLAHHVNLARGAGLDRVVESLTYEIGVTSATWRLKLIAEPTWAIGQKTRAGGMKGAETKHGTPETREARDEEIRAAVAEGLARGLRLTPARHWAAKRLGVSYSTVRRAQNSQ